MTEILVFALLLLCGYLFMKQVALESKVNALKEGHVDKSELEEALEQFLAEVKESNDQLLAVLSDSYEQDVDTYQVKEREQPTFTGLAKGDPGVKPVKQGKDNNYEERASRGKHDPDVKLADQAKANKQVNLVRQSQSDQRARLVSQGDSGRWNKYAHQEQDDQQVHFDNQADRNQREKRHSDNDSADRRIIDNRSKYKTIANEENDKRSKPHDHNENKYDNGQDGGLESVEDKEEFTHSATYSQVFSLRKQGLTVEEIARDLGIGVTEVSLLLRFHEKNDENPHVSSCRESDNMV
ncbi:MAG: Sigma70-r4-2 domain-containing protein [Shouchella clausii]